MVKTCRQCGLNYEITDDDLAFYDKISPVIKDKKYSLPPPSLCPSCRMQNRMSFRNERNLYKRKCDFSGEEIISIYPPTSKYKIYDQKIWWSDKWDEMDYGRPFDFSRSFFKQFEELQREFPRMNLENRNNQNSDFCNDTNDLKNCYLCFNSEKSEDSYYAHTFGYSKNCLDMFWSLACELCYECTKVFDSYHSFWCFNCSNVSDCYFCEDCRGCNNCFGCVGLRHKEYYLYNKQLSKEEYLSFIKKIHFSRNAIRSEKDKLAKLRLAVPRLNLQMQNCEDCLGDYIENSKNCTDCFDVMNSENCRYIWDGIANNSRDCFNSGLDTNFIYECVGVFTGNKVIFSSRCSHCSDLIYCDYCYECENLFGCVGLRHKKYCILNKQYSKEEYEALLPRIIEHMIKKGDWGEFFPVNIGTFGYNDSSAIEYFPLSRDEAMKKGYNWNDYQNPKIMKTKTFQAKQLPDIIQNIPDDIVNSTIECEQDKKPFRIIKAELEFYKKQNLPIPHLCPDCRHYARKKQINPRVMYDRKCAKCGTDIKTTYAPGRPEIVYCENCYLKEIY